MSKTRNRWMYYDKIEAPRFGHRAELVRTRDHLHLMIEEGLCKA